MSSKRDKNKSGILPADDDADDDQGSSGQGGKIEFHDFVTGSGSLRDDQLPPDEMRRLLSIHNDAQKDRVKKQKELRDQRKEAKAGNKVRKEAGQGLSAGMHSQYPPHPILSDKLRGADPQVNPNPSENNVQTNEANRDELQHKYQLRHQPQLTNRPQFNPKPQQ